MMTLAFNWATFGIGFAMVAFAGICILLILVVLIQRPQGGGLAGAFGSGAGSGQTAFGAKTGDALTVATIGFFVVWLLFAIGLNYLVRPGMMNPPQVPAATASESADKKPESKPAEGPASTPAAPATTGATPPATPPAANPTPAPAPVTPPATPAPTGTEPKPDAPKQP